MITNQSAGTFVIQPRRVHVWGELWHALAFTFTGTGSGLYLYLALWGFDERQVASKPLAIGLVFIGALFIFAMELTDRRVFLRYFLANVGQSWISRGVIALLLFGILSVVSLLLENFGPSTKGLSNALTIFAVLASLFVIIYPALLLSSTPVPFWRSTLLPLEFLVSSGVGGLSIVMMFQASGDMGVFLRSVLIAFGSLLIVNLLLHLIHLARISDSTKKETINLLTRGELRSRFLVGFVTLGIGTPLIFVVASYFLEGLAQSAVLSVAGMLALLGIFNQRYCLLKAGFKPSLT